MGLLVPPERTASGYRLYAGDTVDRLRFIGRLQALGLPLKEIRRILITVADGAWPCEHVEALVRRELGEINRRMRELEELKEKLGALLHRLQHRPPDSDARYCPCLDPEQG